MVHRRRPIFSSVHPAVVSISVAAAAVALLLSAGCGGAGTPGIPQAPSSTRQTDLSGDGTTGKSTVPMGRLGLFITAVPANAVLKSEVVPAGETPVAEPAADVAAPAAGETAKPAAAPPAPTTAPVSPPAASVPAGDDATPAAKPVVPNAPQADTAKPATEPPTAAAAPTPNRLPDAAGYDHIWATLLKVELLDANDKTVTAWENTDGLTLDLQTLRDKNGKRLVLLNAALVPSGKAYERVRVTLGKSFELFGKGDSVGQMAPVSDTLARDAEGRPVLSFPLNRPRDLGTGKDNLVLDFDLNKMGISGGRVLPALRENNDATAIADAQQNAAFFAGTISEWTPGKKAGDALFTLTLPGGQNVSVQTTGTTTVYNDNGDASPALGDGKKVRVRGLLALDTKRVMAGQIAVYAGGGNTAASAMASALPGAKPTLASDVTSSAAAIAQAANGPATAPAYVRGTVGHLDNMAGTFIVSAQEVSGLLPTQNAVTVQITPDAVLRSRGGLPMKSEAFYTALAPSGGKEPLALIEGEYEPVTGTFKATRIKLEDASPVPPSSHEVVVEGVPAKANKESGTLSIANLTEWQGMAASDGKNPVAVATTAATQFRNENGEFIASATFFRAAGTPDKKAAKVKPGAAAATPAETQYVRVTGLYSASGVLTATRVELRPAPAASKPDPKDASLTDGTSKETAAAKKDDAKTTEATAKKDGDETTPTVPSGPTTSPTDKPITAPVAPAGVPSTPPAIAPDKKAQ